MDIEAVKRIRLQCLNHAKDLIKGSKALLEEKLPNIAYHLATLALEEVGKSAMTIVGYTRSDEERAEAILQKAGENHARKIFWALWLPIMDKEKITPEDMRSCNEFANTIHLNRMKGLYVDHTREDAYDPSCVITTEQAQSILNLAEARINMEEIREIKELKNEERNILVWFEEVIRNPEKRSVIYNQMSFDKLKELGNDVFQWLIWNKGLIEENDRQLLELARKELERSAPVNEEENLPKWQMKFRLLTSSHSIRQDILNKSNEHSKNRIKFTLGKQFPTYSELIIDRTFAKSVLLPNLWPSSWTETHLIAVAFNIATQGYFWWRLPNDVGDKFYDKIIDLEQDTEIKIERSSESKLKWQRRVLSEMELAHVSMCYCFLPKEGAHFMNFYMRGISFIAKSDIHNSFKKEIFLDFYNALSFAMKYYGDLNDKDNVAEVMHDRFTEWKSDLADLSKEFSQIVQKLMKQEITGEEIPMDQCGHMKILCDFYLLKKIMELAEKK